MNCKKALSLAMLSLVGCGSNVGAVIQADRQQTDDPYEMINDNLRSYCPDWSDDELAVGIVDIQSIQDDGWTFDGARQLAATTCREQCFDCEEACQTCNEALIYRVYDEQPQQTIVEASGGGGGGSGTSSYIP